MAIQINESELISSKKFANVVKSLYGDVSVEVAAKRFAALYKTHQTDFGEDGDFFSSPGRIEIIGNHTDHNNGKVVAGAISVDTLAVASKNGSDIISFRSEGYPAMLVDVNHTKVRADEYGKSVALVRGVVNYFVNNGYKVGGFNASAVSDVAKGAGVSSSSSFEVLIAEILNVYFNDGKVSEVVKAQASQYAENVYFNKPCGLLDQSAISLGGVSYIDFKDTTKPEIKHYHWNFDNLKIVVVNTGGNHSNLTDAYASIREEMEEVAKYFNKSVLREVTKEEFYSNIVNLKKQFNGRALLRAIHYFEENERVDCAVDAIVNTNEDLFCNMIEKSGLSSETKLQNYRVDTDIDELISLGVNYSKTIEGVKASRVHGGGFAGTIISYVAKDAVDNYCQKMKDLFGEKNIFVMSIRESGACKVEVLWEI